MCVWIWVSSRDGRGREPEAVDRPAQVLVLVGAAQRQPLAQRRLVDLDRERAGALEVEHLVADRERDLRAGLAAAAGRRARTTTAGSSPGR